MTDTFLSARTILVPLEASHAKAAFEWLKEPRLYKYIPREPPTSDEAVEARFRFVTQQKPFNSDESWHNWIMLDRDDRRQIGLIEVTLIGRIAYIAYFVRFTDWSKGYASEAVKAVTAKPFVCDIEKVVAEIDTRNAASIAVVRNSGFVEEKVQKNVEFFKGSWSSEVTMVLR